MWVGHQKPSVALFVIFYAEIEYYSIENLEQFLCLGLFQLFLQHDLPGIAAQRKAIKSQNVVGQEIKLVGFLAHLFFSFFFSFSQMMEFFPIYGIGDFSASSRLSKDCGRICWYCFLQQIFACSPN